MTTTEVATTSSMETVRELFAKHKNQIALALPKHMTADRMIRVATTAAAKSPKLLECHPITLLGAVIQAAQLGLEPNDGTGMAWLIPFRNNKKGRMEVQFIPGYRGLISLARRSKEITRFEARVVRKDDRAFDFEYGLEPRLIHKPGPGLGEVTHFYAVAKFTNGDVQFEVMTKEDVDKIRKRSKASGNGPWVSDYEEMGKKTVTRRISKYLPTSIELQKAVNLDEAAERGAPQDLGTLFDPDEKGNVTVLEDGDIPDPKSAIDVPPEPENPEGDEKTGEQGEAAKPAADAKTKTVTVSIKKTTTVEISTPDGGKDGFKLYYGDKAFYICFDKAIKTAADNAKEAKKKVKLAIEDREYGQVATAIEPA